MAATKLVANPSVSNPSISNPSGSNQAVAKQSASILLAALALPGITLPEPALAQSVPEQGAISVKYLDYRDRQPNLDRINVRSPSVSLLVPVAGKWAIQADLVTDSISGASPRFHTAISGASNFSDFRRAADLAVTRYFPRASLKLAVGRSGEHDYVSRYAASELNLSSQDQNTTFAFGLGVSNDTINPVNRIVVEERKHTNDVLLGITQVLGQADVAQVVLTHVRGRGYFNHPYKFVDNRPRDHDQTSVLLRWNHHSTRLGGSNRLSYRYYTSSYGINAHTVTEEFEKPLSNGWTITPSLRLYSQSAADFYFDPVYDRRFGPPFPPGFVFGAGQIVSADQRLSAFGAVTIGLKVAKQLGPNSTLDVKWEGYRQRSNWRQFGSGSPLLQDFSAKSFQIGITHTW